MSGIKRLLADERKEGNRDNAKNLALLLSSDPDAQKVRAWLTKHPGPGFGRNTAYAYQLEDWEGELWFLACVFGLSQPVKGWEIASTETRRKHAQRVAKLARALAEALEEEPQPFPNYPSVLAFFDDAPALKIIEFLPIKLAELLLDGTGYSLQGDRYERTSPPTHYDKGQPQWESPANKLARSLVNHPYSQQFPSLLRQLADYAETRIHDQRHDYRPTVPGVDLRVFARHLALYFSIFSRKIPNEIIAACVRLRFPDFDPPPNEATIRAWRGVK